MTPKGRLVWEAFFLLPIIVSVAVFGNAAKLSSIFTIYLTITFTINICIRFLLLNQKGDWIFFLLGVIAGGGNDLMSMVNGVYNYTSIPILPFLQGIMPLWSVVFWGQVFLLFRKVFLVSWFKGTPFTKNGFLLRGWLSKKLIVDVIILIFLRVSIYNTYLDPLLPSILYSVGILIRFVLFRPKKNEWLIIAILPYAFCFEGLMVTFGLYEYYNPVFLGLPTWLMLWWVFLVPLVLKQVFDMIEYVLEKREVKRKHE